MRPFQSTRFSPAVCVGKVATSSSRASARIRVCVGPTHWPPISTTWPVPAIGWFSSLPPTRSRASRTTTDRPARLEVTGGHEAGEPGADDGDVALVLAHVRGRYPRAKACSAPATAR